MRHLAIIMDGNGRWAKARGHNRFFGHVRGARVAKMVIEECARRKLACLTLFTFSTENWLRPPAEVKFLMHLLSRRLIAEKASLVKNNIQFNVIGDISRLPANVREIVHNTVEETKNCTGMKLVFALSYGGRQDLLEAARRAAADVATGKLPANFSEEQLGSYLATSNIPDPDLIIRTSGEHRLSNFYLWQGAYSELLFVEKLWPDFTSADLSAALEFFERKERRFGRTTDQLQQINV